MLFMLTYEKLLHHYDHRILNYLIMLPDNDYIIINDKFNNNGNDDDDNDDNYDDNTLISGILNGTLNV